MTLIQYANLAFARSSESVKEPCLGIQQIF